MSRPAPAMTVVAKWGTCNGKPLAAMGSMCVCCILLAMILGTEAEFSARRCLSLSLSLLTELSVLRVRELICGDGRAGVPAGSPITVAGWTLEPQRMADVQWEEREATKPHQPESEACPPPAEAFPSDPAARPAIHSPKLSGAAPHSAVHLSCLRDPSGALDDAANRQQQQQQQQQRRKQIPFSSHLPTGLTQTEYLCVDAIAPRTTTIPGRPK